MNQASEPSPKDFDELVAHLARNPFVRSVMTRPGGPRAPRPRRMKYTQCVRDYVGFDDAEGRRLWLGPFTRGGPSVSFDDAGFTYAGFCQIDSDPAGPGVKVRVDYASRPSLVGTLVEGVMSVFSRRAAL